MVNPALFSTAALNITSRLPTTTDPCGLVQYGLPAATDESQFVGKLDYQFNARHSLFGRYIATQAYTPPPFDLEAAQKNLLVTRIGGRDNLAQTFTAGENWVLSNTTLNSLRFAFNRTSIHRTSTDFFSAPEVGINIYSYMPHYMLLMVGAAAGPVVTGTGFQLGGGTESQSTFDTNAWQVSDDLTLVRGDHQFALGVNVAHWASLSLANVRSPGQLTIDGSQTGLPLADFLLGRMGINALVQAAPNTLDMAQDLPRCVRARHVASGPDADAQLRTSLGAVLPAAVRQRRRLPVRRDEVPAEGQEHRLPECTGRALLPGRSRISQPRPACARSGGISGHASGSPGIRQATAVRRSGRSYGKSFEFVNAQFHLDTSVAPPWGSEVRINSPAGGLDNPFVGSGQTNIFPVTFDQNAPFSLNGPFISLSDDMKSTHVHLWNVTVERQIGSWFASAAMSEAARTTSGNRRRSTTPCS